MKRQVLFFGAAAALAVGVSLAAQSAREINYDASELQLSLPANTFVGEVAGVATNSKGQIFVYTRTGHPMATLGDSRTFYHGGSKLFQFDQNGKFVKEVGAGLYGINFAQQAKIDAEDNIWLVDSGSSQVIKFDPTGKFQMVLGRKPENIGVRPGAGMNPYGGAPPPAPEAGRGGEGGGRGNAGPPGVGVPGGAFNQPSDVAFDRAGNIYVADGLANNSRVAKFDKNGVFLKSFGQTGTGPVQFNKVHGIAVDAQGNLYVADAGNNRIQVLDGEGTFKSEIKGIGSPQAICISGGATQYLYSSNSNDMNSMDNGEIYKIQLNGQVVGKFGKAGKLIKDFGMVNSLDCRTENSMLVGEVWNWRIQKVMLKP